MKTRPALQRHTRKSALYSKPVSRLDVLTLSLLITKYGWRAENLSPSGKRIAADYALFFRSYEEVRATIFSYRPMAVGQMAA